MDRDRAMSRAEAVLGLCPAGLEAEVLLAGGRLDLTRFAQDRIHQNVSEDDILCSIRLQEGKRAARVSLNGTDPERARLAVRDCHEALRASPEVPELLPLPGPQSYREIAGTDPATTEVTPEERAERVSEAVAIGRQAGLRCAGYLSITSGTLTSYASLVPFLVANSRGLRAYQWRSEADFVFTCEGEDSSGWAQGISRRFADIDVAALARRATEKARRSARPIAVDACPRTAVLEPAATGELLGFLGLIAFGALEYIEGRSVFSGRLGEKLFPQETNFCEDPYHPALGGRAFDDEGMPRKRVPLIENGVVAGVVHDRRTAQRAGAETTGHSLAMPNVVGPAVSSLVLHGGEASPEELIQGVEDGVLVTRFWYVNVVDPARAILTGMTRDGTFQIQGGELGSGVRNMRFNQSVPDLLSNIVARGRSERTEWGWMPALVVKDFGFSSVTEF